MRLVLFDIDGTLIRGLSTELTFMGYLFRRGKIGPTQGLAWLYFTCRWLPRYGALIGKKNKAYLTALQQSEVSRIASEFVFKRCPEKSMPQLWHACRPTRGRENRWCY
ncbi:MAG: hypothetical protein HC808_09810 [Candidatus Competibacteraceae bacterium]|nr:hypothetical protein [Candidatus Competibacteraceae bacterium]